MRSASQLHRVLGYECRDRALLRAALTHRSSGPGHNERLEFLGDAVLSLVVSEALYRRFPGADEGTLSRSRSQLVNRERLAQIARDLGIGQHLSLGEGEERCGGRERESILADAVEAIIGAIYLDGGLEACRGRVLPWLDPVWAGLAVEAVEKDPKTELQELLQAHQLALPVYEIVAIAGKPHDRMFTVCCRSADLGRAVTAEGSSRRRAEQAAARRMLDSLQDLMASRVGI